MEQNGVSWSNSIKIFQSSPFGAQSHHWIVQGTSTWSRMQQSMKLVKKKKATIKHTKGVLDLRQQKKITHDLF